MSGNLVEFIKVFTLVFAFSGLILAGRRYMLKWDEKPGKKIDTLDSNLRGGISATESESDVVDYDGMGNQGRFPTKG